MPFISIFKQRRKEESRKKETNLELLQILFQNGSQRLMSHSFVGPGYFSSAISKSSSTYLRRGIFDKATSSFNFHVFVPKKAMVLI